MKRMLLAGALLGMLACGRRWYDNDEVELMAASSAVETCSCVFVVGFDDARCADYSRLIGPRQVVRLDVNREEHTVDAMLLGRRARARWVSTELGCVLE